MAPVQRPQSFFVSICNRTYTHVTAYSEQFEVEKTKYLAHPARSTRRRIPCMKVIGNDDVFSVTLLDKDSTDVLHELRVDLSDFVGRASNDIKWKSAANHGKHLRILHRCLSSADVQVMLLPTRNPSSFLSLITNDTPLTTLCLPGTHESLALYGWPISTCQSIDSNIEKQLNDGIRYLDIRLAPMGQAGKQRLLAYHGITDERMEFGKVLEDCWNFFDGIGKDETIIMSLKQEQGDQDAFIKLLFLSYVDQSPASKDGRLAAGKSRWFLEDRVPNLGEVRGKIVMLSRFVIAESYGFSGGISPPIWPNSQKGIFQYELRGSHQVVQTQDWYDIGSLSAIPDKVALIKQLCQESGSNGQVLSLNYCNGSSFPFALPPAVAKGFLDDGTMMGEEKSSLMRLLAREGVNSQVRDFVANILFSNVSPLPRQGAVDELKIVWALDYYNEPKGAADLVPILIEANF